MVIRQGDVYWMDLGEPAESEPGYMRPYVVIQNNVFNLSNINTIVVCAITSNMKRSIAPENIVLANGEANLPKPSVVLVSQLLTVNKSQLEEYIGALSQKRVAQILRGIELILEQREVD